MLAFIKFKNLLLTLDKIKGNDNEEAKATAQTA
jgi:hypothetical protein